MPEYAFTENLEEVIGQTILDVFELTATSKNDPRNSYGIHSHYSLSIDQQFGGFNIPVMFPKELISSNDSAIIDDYKKRLKEGYNNYVLGTIAVGYSTQYLIDINKPKINPIFEQKNIEKSDDFFDPRKAFDSQSVKMITINVDKNTRKIENEDLIKQELSVAIDEMVDREFDFDIEFYKTMGKQAAIQHIFL